MHRNRPRALYGDPAVDSNTGATGYREVNFLGGGEVDVLGSRDKLDVFLGKKLHLIALRLQVDVVFGGDQLDAGITFARDDGAGQQANGLAGVDSGFAGNGEIGVFATGQGQCFAVGELQALAGDATDAGLAGLEDGRVGEVREFVGGMDVLLLGIAPGAFLIPAIDHTAGDGVQGFEWSGLVVDFALVFALRADTAGELDSLVGSGGLVEGLGQGVGLFEQGDGGGHVAGGLFRGAAPCGDDHALSGTQGAPRVGAEFDAGAAEGAAIVVGLVDEVAEVELAAVLGGGELDALLLVGVVEGKLAVALPSEFLALEAGQRGGVAMAAGGAAVPGRTVAGGGVALATGAVVGGGIEERITGFGLALAARGRSHTALPLPVVEGAKEDGAVDVTTHEVDEDFLPDAGQPLPTHSGAGLPVEDAHPAGVTVIFGFGLLPVEADLDPAQGVAPEFVGSFRASFTVGADDEGAHRPGRGGTGIDAGAGAVAKLRAPGTVGGMCCEAVAVAAFNSQFEEFGWQFNRSRRGHNDFTGSDFAGIGHEPAAPQTLGDGNDGFSTEIIDADMDDLGRQVTVFSFGVDRINRQADKIEGRSRTQAAHGAPAKPTGLPGFSGFHGETAVAFGFTGIGPGVEARVVVAFEEWCILATTGPVTGNAEGDAPLGLVIVADGSEMVTGQPPLLPEGEHTVLIFLRVGTMKADTPPTIGRLRDEVFRNLLAIGKDAQAVAGRGFGIFLNTPAKTFFGE